MPTTCLLCCEQSQCFLMPPCNHKQMCWKCCLKLIEGSIFSCPFCKGTPDGKSCILFVNEQEMNSLTFQQIFKRGALRSAVKSSHYYSNSEVAKYVEQQTSFFCRLCFEVFDNLNFLKKHLYQKHRHQFCDVCLQNRKCLISEQYLFTEGELISHQKKGQFSEDGELVLYHPLCQFCKTRFYDSDAFRVHLRMSSHLKCHICEQNYPHLKYVYYRDIDEIQKHFSKSHFMCDQGACIGRKLENVFVSTGALEQHVNKVHNKFKTKQKGEVMNLLLFQNKVEQQAIQWDKIGKDLSMEFKKTEKTSHLINQQHKNGLIDIRQFYPEKVKPDNKLSTKDIIARFNGNNNKSNQISLISVPLFTPLSSDCINLQRYEIQKLVRAIIYEPRISQQIITIFFTRLHDYKSPIDYCWQLRRKISAFRPLAFYYVFPQLIRFLRNENLVKKVMDQFYSESLRELIVTKQFIFHKKSTYIEIFTLIQEQIENFMYQELFEDRIDINLYLQYLKEMNSNLYIDHHHKIFYVQKDKMINLYHMIQKCKTQELPRLSWLLKVGFSQESHKILLKQFYYRTIDDCSGYIRKLSLQQIALLYAYINICIDALLDKDRFKFNKEHCQPFFLSQIFIKIPAVIEPKKRTNLEQVQRNSIKIASIQPSSNNRRIIYESDHPSLLSEDINLNRNDAQFPSLSINAQVKMTKQTRTKVKNIPKKVVISPLNTKKQEDYPSLVQVDKKGLDQQEQQEQFPVFNYHQKFINPKNREQYKKQEEKQEKMKQRSKKYQNLNDDSEDSSLIGISKQAINMGLFSKKTQFQDHHFEKKQKQPSENQSISKNEEYMPSIGECYDKRAEPPKEVKNNNKKKDSRQSQNKIIENVEKNDNNDFGDGAIILINKKNKQLDAQEQNTKRKKQQKKKTKKIQESFDNQSLNKTSKNKNQKPKNIQGQDGEDFPSLGGGTKQNQDQQNEKKMNFNQIPPKKKRKVRLDMSDSDDQARRQQEKRRQFEEKKKKIADDEIKKKKELDPFNFDSLMTHNEYYAEESIVNKIINSNKIEQKQPERKIKKKKNGKSILIEKVDFRRL